MKRSARCGAVSLALASLVAPAIAWSQDATGSQPGPAAVGVADEQQPPSQAPPPPPLTPPSPEAARPVAPAPSVPRGQWVDTWQYGWVWMPYDSPYTYLPPGPGDALMYVYGPAFGWAWVDAPWVWGWGPWPFFGVAGFGHFCWYDRGPFRRPGWRPAPWPTWTGRPALHRWDGARLAGGARTALAPGHAWGPGRAPSPGRWSGRPAWRR